MSNLSNSALCSLLVAIPRLAVQVELVKKIQAVKSKMQQLKTRCSRNVLLLSELMESVLRRAFAGELIADSAESLVKAAA